MLLLRRSAAPLTIARLAAASASLMLCVLCALCAACGSAQSGLEGAVYRSDRVAFKVGEVPASWTVIRVDAANVAYRDEPNRASVLANGRCGRKDDDTPLSALTAHLVMGTTAREIASQETIPFDGREAMHTRMQAKLDGVPMAYDLYVLKKDGCVYDLVYVGDPRAFESGVPAFERFVSGFHTLSGAGDS
jgi:hypothetical protein